MASTNSSKKRIRQNIKRRALNRWRLRTMRTAIKGFQQSLAAGNAEEATQACREASKVIDRSAQKGVIHRNQAARRKSRMNKALKAMKSAG